MFLSCDILTNLCAVFQIYSFIVLYWRAEQCSAPPVGYAEQSSDIARSEKFRQAKLFGVRYNFPGEAVEIMD